MADNVDINDSLDKAFILGKKIECYIGLFFLIPPVLGVLFFVTSVFGGNGDVQQLENLSGKWTTCYGYVDGGGGGMSAAPIYLGLMAIVGAYLIKNSLKYLFIKSDTPLKGEKQTKDNTIS